ncbi:MAG: AraC family transcriptional regulator [Synergistales bacterium]|nr:AraC family transcriptional regulator [Synergistales bacterium]
MICLGVNIYRDKKCPFFEIKMGNTSSVSYRKHVHEEYSLGFVIKGETNFWYDGRIQRIGANSVVFLPPGFIHSCNPLDLDCWKYGMLFLDAGWFEPSMINSGVDIDIPMFWHGPERPFRCEIEEMVEILMEDLPPFEKESHILTIIHQLSESRSTERYISSEREIAGLEVIRKYLENHFVEKISLDDLEDLSGLSKYNIIRGFKDVLNISPHPFQTMLRINHAKKKLKNGSPPLKVALDTGFYDQSHFIKAFKDHVGMTPNQYRVSGDR